ncbi:hypothetical protein CBM2634_B100127 [Cupriavidus taiwanensis]|uniref:Uncharacterized protein n=2 Tax=Cupriavidus taiwanensis TaxID=164546 RepID=A0A375J3H5_9BURK|nr:hypothetical protein CBM2634_B100127 [Cupriavidus taiwanensis]
MRLLGMQCIFGAAKLDFVKQAGKPKIMKFYCLNT